MTQRAFCAHTEHNPFTSNLQGPLREVRSTLRAQLLSAQAGQPAAALLGLLSAPSDWHWTHVTSHSADTQTLNVTLSSGPAPWDPELNVRWTWQNGQSRCVSLIADPASTVSGSLRPLAVSHDPAELALLSGLRPLLTPPDLRQTLPRWGALSEPLRELMSGPAAVMSSGGRSPLPGGDMRICAPGARLTLRADELILTARRLPPAWQIGPLAALQRAADQRRWVGWTAQLHRDVPVLHLRCQEHHHELHLTDLPAGKSLGAT